MKKDYTWLPGVNRIGWIDCEKLQRRVDLHGICETVVPILTEITEIDFFDEAEAGKKTSKENGSRVDDAKIKFHCATLLPIHKHLGFIVTDNSGQDYLIGCAEPPYPKINVELGVGDCDGDGAGFYYEITHTAICTMMKCVASY